MKTNTTKPVVFLNKVFKKTNRKPTSFTTRLALNLIMGITIMLFSSNVFAQVLPDATSCTSKDLILLEASLPAASACDNCTEGTTQTRTLYLSIDNKTGSKRTSFAFWGTLKIYNADGTLNTAKTRLISGCAGPIEPTSINNLPFYINELPNGTISYLCGESLQLTDLFLAWTTSNKKETCPLESSLIAPKCGTVPSIQIYTGLDATAVATAATCTSGGSILVTPFGGKADYTVAIVNGASRTVAAGGSTNFTGLSSGNYTINITDADGCTISKVRNVGSSSTPANPTTPVDVTACGNGSEQTLTATASVPSGISIVWYDAASGGNVVNTATLVSTVGATRTLYAEAVNVTTGCTSSGRTAVVLTINAAPSAPTAPVDVTVCTNGTEQTLTATATVPSGFSIVWYDADSGGNVVSPATLVSTAAATRTLHGEAVNTTTNCKSLSRTPVILTINESPATPTADVTQPTCGLSTGTINVTNPPGGLSYSINSTTVFSNTNGTFSGLSDGTYYIRARNTNGCISAPLQKVIQAAPDAPATPVVIVVQAATCYSAEIILEVTSPLDGGGVDYEYKNGNGSWQDTLQFTINAGAGFSIVSRRKDDTTCVSSAATCPDPPAEKVSEVKSGETILEKIEPTIKAFPNPFKNTINFVVEVPESGEGSLDVMNMFGQKVKTIFKGTFKEGKNTYEVNVPSHQSSTLIYILTIGDKRLTGKLIQM